LGRLQLQISDLAQKLLPTLNPFRLGTLDLAQSHGGRTHGDRHRRIVGNRPADAGGNVM
jgi:hypothetical protein